MATKIAASNIQAQSSAQLAGMISDPTGSGKFVLDTNPIFSTSISVNGTVGPPLGQLNVHAGLGTSFYNAGFRNDGGWVYLLSSNIATTAAAAATAGFNSFRPFYWNLSTGAVTIDGTGIGTGFGGAIVATGDVTAFSDIRVKTNIATITNAISTVQQLRGVSFTRSDTGLPSIGVIAQEIQQVIPEVVHENSEGMLSVAYGNIVGLLIEAVKEQQVQIDHLRTITRRSH